MKTTETITVGKTELQLETGELARQADGAVLLSSGDTTLLVAVVAKPSSEKRDFMPLLVDYREQTYAAGKIPGGYFKREGRPRDRETLVARATDRAMRPRFPKGMMDNTQISIFLLSYDKETDLQSLGVLGASAALHISNIPFSSPLGAVRVGRVDGKLVLNPSNTELVASDMDLLVAGGKGIVNMIEMASCEVDESLLMEAFEMALPQLDALCDVQERLRAKVGVPKREPTLLPVTEEMEKRVAREAENDVLEALRAGGKTELNSRLKEIKTAVLEALESDYPDAEVEINDAFETLVGRLFRSFVTSGKRVGDRRNDEVRPLYSRVSVLKRVHGSAVFQRGETQALVATTLGTFDDIQRLGELDYDENKSFILHYNFHGFSTAEVKPERGPSRRDIGHGNLAEHALETIIPPQEAFPYTVRLVADILESNGSTSMATVCGGTLALMDAGVPITRPCAGISIGLVKDGETRHFLTDIAAIEDHYGDMDFKVAGTAKGVNAIQMDVKMEGLVLDDIKRALDMARAARLAIIEHMATTLPAPRETVSEFAPKIVVVSIDKSKIGEVIGPGGKVIRNISETTECQVDIDDLNGRVVISGTSMANLLRAKEWVEGIVAEPELNKVYKGKIARITAFGAFVTILPGKDGLCHISELDKGRVDKVEDLFKEGDEIEVKVIGIDEMGKVRLSRRAILLGEDAETSAGRRDRQGGGDRRGGRRGPRRGGGGSHERRSRGGRDRTKA